MSYIALYRKYRPTKFEDVVGQSYVVKVLENSITNNKLSHAYLFSGPRGTGKTTLAKLIAKLVNCENRNGLLACDNCPSCEAFNNKNDPDIIEMDAASNNGVDEIREIKDNVALIPSLSKYKVYIIDEVHMLSPSAFNALLKTLEEPPKHVIFILATTEFYKVPETIVSRCQCFEFERISIENIVNRLNFISKKENISIDDDTLNLIAKYSDGGMRDAIGMLDKLFSSSSNITKEDFYNLKGIVGDDFYKDLVVAILNNDISKADMLIQQIISKGKNIFLLIDGLLEYLKNLIIENLNISTNVDFYYDIINYLNDLFCNMKQSVNPYIIFETGIISYILKHNKIISREIISEDTFEKNKTKENGDLSANIGNNSKVKIENDVESNDIIINKNNVNFDTSSREIIRKINKPDYTRINKIIINNAFATANKQKLASMKEKWNDFNDYLYNDEFSSIVSYFIDGVIRVAGDEDILISIKYESLIDSVNNNITKVELLFGIVFGKMHHIAFVLDSEWEKLKNKYINDKKNGVVYTYIKENIEEEKKDDIINDVIVTKSESNNSSIASDLFGDDIVEFE